MSQFSYVKHKAAVSHFSAPPTESTECTSGFSLTFVLFRWSTVLPDLPALPSLLSWLLLLSMTEHRLQSKRTGSEHLNSSRGLDCTQVCICPITFLQRCHKAPGKGHSMASSCGRQRLFGEILRESLCKNTAPQTPAVTHASFGSTEHIMSTPGPLRYSQNRSHLLSL